MLLARAIVVYGLGLIVLDRTGILYPVKSETQVLLRPVERTLTQTRMAIGSFVDALLGAPPIDVLSAPVDIDIEP